MLAACDRDAPAPAPPDAPTLEQVIAQDKADRAAADRAAGDHLAALAAAAQKETRNEAWATKQSRALRASYVASGFRAATMTGLDCRANLCAGQAAFRSGELVGEEPADAALSAWLSSSQPCAYAVATTQGGGATNVQFFVDCRPAPTAPPRSAGP
jgi:hypothetical protein